MTAIQIIGLLVALAGTGTVIAGTVIAGTVIAGTVIARSRHRPEARHFEDELNRRRRLESERAPYMTEALAEVDAMGLGGPKLAARSGDFNAPAPLSNAAQAMGGYLTTLGSTTAADLQGQLQARPSNVHAYVEAMREAEMARQAAQADEGWWRNIVEWYDPATQLYRLTEAGGRQEVTRQWLELNRGRMHEALAEMRGHMAGAYG